MATANLQELDTKGISRSGITQQKLALPVITLITGFLVIAPLLILFRTSFLPPGKLPFDTVEFTLNNFVACVRKSRHITASLQHGSLC